MRPPVVVVLQTTQYGARDELYNHLWFGFWHSLARDSLSIAFLRDNASLFAEALNRGEVATALERYLPPY